MQETQETQVQSLGWDDPLEKEMANHSSILAWKIPWTGSLAGYSPWGHNESDTTERLHFHFHAIWKRIHEKNYALKMFCSLVNIALMPISSCDILLQ